MAAKVKAEPGGAPSVEDAIAALCGEHAEVRGRGHRVTLHAPAAGCTARSHSNCGRRRCRRLLQPPVLASCCSQRMQPDAHPHASQGVVSDQITGANVAPALAHLPLQARVDALNKLLRDGRILMYQKGTVLSYKLGQPADSK